MANVNNKREISLSSFYNHNRFMASAREGARLMERLDREDANTPRPRKAFKVGDKVTGGIYRGVKGTVKSVETVNGYHRYTVKYDTGGTHNCRQQDLKLV
jgi:hypothetical protein